VICRLKGNMYNKFNTVEIGNNGHFRQFIILMYIFGSSAGYQFVSLGKWSVTFLSILWSEEGLINFIDELPEMASCMVSKISSSCWVNCNKVNSISLTAVYVELCPKNVRLNQSRSRVICWYLSWDWIILLLTMLERFAILSVLSDIVSATFFTYVNWFAREWTISEFLFCKLSSTPCNSWTSDTVAVPKIVFRILPPRLSKPRRGSGRGKIW